MGTAIPTPAALDRSLALKLDQARVTGYRLDVSTQGGPKAEAYRDLAAIHRSIARHYQRLEARERARDRA